MSAKKPWIYKDFQHQNFILPPSLEELVPQGIVFLADFAVCFQEKV